MRRLLALALAAVACSGDRQASSTASASSAPRGPDQIVLRIARAGGTARAYVYPRLDSVVWAAAGAPPVSRMLGFDPDFGLLALVDDKDRPRRIDLRLTEVRLASRTVLTSIASADGNEIYGVTVEGDVKRLTPAGDWSFDPPSPARWVFPQPNGFVVIAGMPRSQTPLWRIRPTDDEILDSASLPPVTRGLRAQLGDRLYFAVDSGLVGVKTGDLSPLKSVRFVEPVVAMVPTPSGDRLYVALRGATRLSVVDRYSEAIAGAVALPGPVSELRMDPLGQAVLARPARVTDSAWVIRVGGDRVAGTIGTSWRNDLPAFAPGPTIATARGNDVVFLETRTLQDVRTVSGGAKDFWYFFSWNGFRPRSAGLDQPVTFESRDSVMLPDSALIVADSARLSAPPMRDTSPTMIQPPASYPPSPPRPTGFLVSFAAVLTQQKANELTAGIAVNGVRPRVVPSQSGSTTIYRVVLGPYGTREEAERIGRDSQRPYWVYEAPR